MPQLVRLSSKNQVVIPQEARKELDLKPGQVFLVVCRDSHILLIPRPDSYVDRLAELHAGLWDDCSGDEYLRQERDSWKD